jgi:hypothetical protein
MRTEDMVLKATRLLNLVLTGMLTGNEFGRLVGFHPALYELPTEAHARGERAITSRFGKLRPSLHEGCDLVLCAGPLTP